MVLHGEEELDGKQNDWINPLNTKHFKLSCRKSQDGIASVVLLYNTAHGSWGPDHEGWYLPDAQTKAFIVTLMVTYSHLG